ncbi:MAG TPA: AraC family transcriptional regulator [Porticoccaceae bacterium]|nr:AraC family transcriptional regulator [Porticoccaceae bacterium]HIK80913.1 AraC family transcriptional regulator [Porticoccaceae bacterium]
MNSSYIGISASKFKRLLDYLQRLDLDDRAIALKAGLNSDAIQDVPDNDTLSAYDYSQLFKQSVLAMQTLRRPLPWGAGVGSEIFEMLCRCLIGCNSLGEALLRAERFDALLNPLSGYKISVHRDQGFCYLRYHINPLDVDEVFIPSDWDRSDTYHTVMKASGLLVWHALCGWLIGRTIEAQVMQVSEPSVGCAYTSSLEQLIDCSVEFDADVNQLVFSEDFLDFRLVQTADSLEQFLKNAVYELILSEKKPASTSAAIKSLVGLDFEQGMPTFSEIASKLHMSESSLRRRLLKEKTSYQILKDELRCASAIDHLNNTDIKINDLSYVLGYTEPSSFVRSFRNWTGMTPKMYRENSSF